MSSFPLDSSPQIPTVEFTVEDRSFLRTILREAAGIEIGADRDTLLASRLTPIIRRHGLADIATLVRTLRIGNRQLENEVIEAMTTNETSFFRDPNVFEDLGSHLIPELLDRLPANQPLTIWSAASSSGQEAYSLAILFHELFPQMIQARRVRILATDLSQEMVDRTRDGAYTKLEVRRGLSDERLARFFDLVGNNYLVQESLRSIVLSRTLNLVHSLGPLPRCDLVLIRNVLIYFPPEVKATVLRNIRRFVLPANGALVLGASEMMGPAQKDFVIHDLPTMPYFTPRPIGAS